MGGGPLFMCGPGPPCLWLGVLWLLSGGEGSPSRS
jgi:hypothetical protein